MKNLKRSLGICILLFFLIESASAQKYRILISNDDGIESPLLKTLSEELAKLPDVEVVISAPSENQSGSSQSTDGRTLKVEKISKDNEFFGYAVSGRPADAVRFGLRVLGKEEPFDLVISGINRGSNVGKLSHLSGTVGAAMEAIYHGIPAIAVSQEVRGVNTKVSAEFVSQVVSKYKKNGAPKGVVISINIPAGELKGVSINPMGDAYLDMGNYVLRSDSGNTSVYQQRLALAKAKDSNSDTYAYQQGFITITPLKFDWTAYELLQSIAEWGLEIKN
ncbi:5'/3'-nucleotidase SurE [Roseivirga sp. E12]|uniref:5'/3'-nucleotidase SurE n=1 Tax=Roseivirga sp. E12 TaxID=2819237 RepID=UPI001ABCAA7D|nr:5'/3'-nucleotidase SurE [Roseivirga sp. E12]MBO3697672.1 5'/3'-nucleotidase SurE [Roseivirga sp. E12]